MIIELRQHLEKTLAVPVHWVAISEREPLPCCTLAKTLLSTHHELQRRNGWAVTGVDLTIYSLCYEQLDELAASVGDDYDGRHEPLKRGSHAAKIYIDDEDDDAYPAPDGSDDWIYARQISIRVHHKIKG